MGDDELRELQDPETWEEGGELHPPVKSSRAIVSVAFARDDFERVVREARRCNMRTSEFIRAAALDRIDAPRDSAQIVSVVGLEDNDYPVNRTRAPRGTARTSGSGTASLVSG